MIYKPQALTIKRKGNPEQLVRDWEEYIKEFEIFLGATIIARSHKPEIAGEPCVGCKNAKMLLMLVGGTEAKTLHDHVSRVADTDSWEEALKKISDGITSQTDSEAKQGGN